MTVFQPESPSGDPYSQRLKLPIADFILDRLAEDEAAARYAQTHDEVDDRAPGGWGGWWLGHYQHYHRHDPARVLREVEAKRAIVRLHGGDYDGECQSPAHLDGPCRTLRALAAVYADHPDYRAEWAL